MEEKQKNSGGLRQRWMRNIAGLLSILGLICALAVTTSYAAYYYSNMSADMYNRAKTTTEFFSEYVNQDYTEYYQSCITYAQTFSNRNQLELQFIDKDGRMVASSYGPWAGPAPQTPEIQKAMSTRGIQPFQGRDPKSGQRIIAVSSPIIFSSGEVIGVLRFVSATVKMDRQIMGVALVSVLALAAILVLVLLSSDLFIRSVMNPVSQITEKAKRIASGSYGAQIKTQYADEIGELADTINEMSVKISQNEKMQAEFISQLSHELRTPLTVINGWSETLLADDTLSPDTSQGLKIISSEAKRLTEMVMELLDFTRLQDGRMTLNVEPTDIRTVFEDTVFMYSSRLSQDGMKLEYLDNDAEIPEVPCDAKRMRQVFLNVLDNAAKHGREGVVIEASIGCEDGNVVVRIRDHGPGIPADELPLVKKKFYKGSSKARGTGIGLAVCDEIMELHGGSLTLENAPGGGTLVLISLPVGQ